MTREPKTPKAVEELYGATSLDDEAKTYAKWYRMLDMERLNLRATKAGNVAKDTDPAPGPPGQPGFLVDDGEAEVDNRKVRSYRQQHKHLTAGMAETANIAHEAVGQKLFEEKVDELKKDPEAF